jgi:hypothetical protein
LAGAAGVAAARRPRAEQWRRRGGICQCTCHGHVGAARTPLASDCLGLLSDTVSMAMDNALPGPRARPGRRRHTVHVRLASNLMGWPLGYRVGEYFLTGHRTGLQPNGHFLPVSPLLYSSISLATPPTWFYPRTQTYKAQCDTFCTKN